MDETAVWVDQNVTLLHHWRRCTRQIRSNQIGGHRQDRIRIRLRVRIVLLLMTMMMTLTWDRHRKMGSTIAQQSIVVHVLLLLLVLIRLDTGMVHDQ